MAVKCLHFKLSSDAERENLVRDFKQEINLMKDLKHPNVVQILGQCENYNTGKAMWYVSYNYANVGIVMIALV